MSRSTNSGATRSKRRCRPTRRFSDLGDAETHWPNGSTARITATIFCGLLFICCHPELPATQQIALALRIVSGLSVKQIARAFLVSEAAIGAAHYAGKEQSRGSRRAVRDAGRGGAQASASPRLPR